MRILMLILFAAVVLFASEIAATSERRLGDPGGPANPGNGGKNNGNQGGNNGVGNGPKMKYAPQGSKAEGWICVLKDEANTKNEKEKVEKEKKLKVREEFDDDDTGDSGENGDNGSGKPKLVKALVLDKQEESQEEYMKEVEKYSRDPSVEFCEENQIVRLDDTPWGLDRIDQNFDENTVPIDHADYLGYNEPYSLYNGTGVHVFIMDSGINGFHEEFTGRIGKGRNTIDGTTTSEEVNNDCGGHGTHVAGTCCGTTYGVASGVTIHPVKIFDGDGCDTSDSTRVLGGMRWVKLVQKSDDFEGLSVLNLSFSAGGVSGSLDRMVRSLVGKGAVVVTSAGNDNGDACNVSPNREPLAITVAASTANDRKAGFSNYGSCVDIFAPGEEIKSANIGPPSASSTKTGTSMAAPHVTGAVALAIEEFPDRGTNFIVDRVAVRKTLDGVLIGNLYGSPKKLLSVHFHRKWVNING